MMAVITRFMDNVQGDEQATREADSEPKYVDKGKKPIVPDIAPGNLKIISQHSISICIYEELVIHAKFQGIDLQLTEW